MQQVLKAGSHVQRQHLRVEAQREDLCTYAYASVIVVETDDSMALRASLVIYHLVSNERSWNNR